jgi:hypothetical protein
MSAQIQYEDDDDRLGGCAGFILAGIVGIAFWALVIVGVLRGLT